MPIKIRLFAGLADAVGASQVTIELPEGQPAIRADRIKDRLAELHPHAAALLKVSFVAVNQAYASDDQSVSANDEVAIIPPVSGGQEAVRADNAWEAELFCLTDEPISIEEVTDKVIDAAHGAALTFTGTTREYTQGIRTVRLEYEAYAPMAVASMKQIGDEIADRWPGTRTAITHRLGVVDIREISVVIAVSSPHRAECYEASRYAIERLKQIVPIWKKEIWENGSEWKGHQLGPWNPLAPPQPDRSYT